MLSQLNRHVQPQELSHPSARLLSAPGSHRAPRSMPCRQPPPGCGSCGSRLCLKAAQGKRPPHNPRGPSAEHLCRERSCSLWGHPLDLHCWSYQGGTGLAEMPNWLLLSLPGPSASRAVTVVTREGNQAELSPATRETCTNLTAN